MWNADPFKATGVVISKNMAKHGGKMGELPLQIKSAKVYSGAHPAVNKFRGKKLEELTFDDYKVKTPVFVEWQDVIGIRRSDYDGFLSKNEMYDVLTDFQKRLTGFADFESERNFTLMCREGVNELDTVGSENQCTMPERSDTCCCPQNGILKAGENVCLKVDGAPKKDIYSSPYQGDCGGRDRCLLDVLQPKCCNHGGAVFFCCCVFWHAPGCWVGNFPPKLDRKHL